LSEVPGGGVALDMTEIVEKTGVVGVSFNYRLGPLGFFSHPDEPSARRSESATRLYREDHPCPAP
jgi:carboxylesterase type B